MTAAETTVKWLDLSAHGVKLRLFQQTDKIVNLVLTGVQPESSEWLEVQKLGFVPSPSGRTLVREGADVQTGALRRIFPRNVVRTLPVSSIWIRVKGQESGQSKPAAAEIESSFLGRNADGEPVHADQVGQRYVLLASGSLVREGEASAQPSGPQARASDDGRGSARFLRAADAEQLAICADAFVGEMIAGRNMDSVDMRHFGGVIFASSNAKPTPIDATDARLRTLQEAIEASMQRSLSSRYRDAGEEAYRFAVGLSERQPTFAFRTSSSIANQQYSTPLPMSIAAQHIFGDTSGGKMLDPAIGNGSLVMALADDTEITGVEIDEARAAQARMLRSDMTIVVGDALKVTATLGSDFDYVVANPPFGGLKPAVQFDDLRVTRVDHLIALKALARRTDNGRAVFIVGADRESSVDGGKIAGGSSSFFAWLCDHYVVEDAIELDGALYRKQGTDCAVRMITVGRRRTLDDARFALQSEAYRIGERLPVISTWDELWGHAQALAIRLRREDLERHEVAAPAIEDKDYRALALEYLRWLKGRGTQSIEQVMPGVYRDATFQLGAPLVKAGYIAVDGQASFRLKDLWNEIDAELKTSPDATDAKAGLTTTPSPGVAEPARSEAEQTPPQEAVVNEFQAPYIPASKINEPTAMIPRNLEGPVRRALAALVDEIGIGVDDYVADKLQMEPEELELAFSAEQIDAIALAIKRTEEGRGFINGDQTGQGKGRVLGALARYAALNKIPVVFLTEKANLFSDFWRDLKDIDSSRLFRPLILNDDEPIRNLETGKIELPATKSSTVQRIMAADTSLADSGYNLMLATYSQFNRERSASKKAMWLSAASKGAMILVDESHVAAGDSNTADNIGMAVESAGSCVYSSATFAKNAKNMRAYAKVFPSSVAPEWLADTLQAGGEPLQEILSAMLAEEGVFIRREHDLSKLEFETIVTQATQERDEQWADALSDVLRAMAYFSGDVARVMKRMDKEIKKTLEALPESVRKGNRMGVSYQGFGSRLYNILRQFYLAIKIDPVAEQALIALREGRKPVVVLEQTFESMLKEALAESMRVDEESLEPGAAVAQRVDSAFALGETGRMLPALTFRDVVSRVAEKLTFIYVRDRYGVGRHVHVENQAEDEEELQQIRAHIAEIHEKISRLPDIPVSPIDTLRQKLKDTGHTQGEISGRTFQTSPVPSDPSQIQVLVRPDQRIQTLADFNNGRIDALALTRAGATGLSAHSSAKFADQRQRGLIEAQIANNVAERVQFFGRVNRRGQVNSPRITSVITSLPSEMRALAMQNTKLRKLSANTQSNRNNLAELRDVPDILNPVGDEICRRYLEEHPDVATLLDIDPEQTVESADEAYFANKLTGRIALLPVARQREVYADLTRVFNETIKDMAARGINPFQTSVWEWGAKIVSKEVYIGGNLTGSVFDEPVYLARIEWEEDVVPLSSDYVKSLIQASRHQLATTDGRLSIIENPSAVGELGKVRLDHSKLEHDIDRAFAKVQEAALKIMPDFDTLDHAIQSEKPNAIKNAEGRRRWLKRNLSSLMPGSIVSFTGSEERVEKGLVCGLFLPDQLGHAHLLGQYTVRIAVPGNDKLVELTANQLMSDPLFATEFALGKDFLAPLKAFETTQPGRRTFSRQILLGNMFRASQFLAQHPMGRAGIFTDDTGSRHRAVVLFNWVSREDVTSIPVALTRPQIERVLELAYNTGQSVRLVASASLADKQACSVTFDKTRPASLSVTVPGSKARGGIVYANKHLLAITGDFAGNRTLMSATVDFSKMQPVIAALVGGCGQSFFMDADQAREMLPELVTVVDGVRDARSAEIKDSLRPRFAA